MAAANKAIPSLFIAAPGASRERARRLLGRVAVVRYNLPYRTLDVHLRRARRAHGRCEDRRTDSLVRPRVPGLYSHRMVIVPFSRTPFASRLASLCFLRYDDVAAASLDAL